jgi:hypothetical protein
MVRVPDEFEAEFERKGETFFSIAELFYTNPGHQFTQDELADKFDVRKQTISEHLETMAEWLDVETNQHTYQWNLEKADPANTGLIDAIAWFYRDLRHLLRTHTQRTTGILAIAGFFMFVTAFTILFMYVLYWLPITPQSNLPSFVYLIIAGGMLLSGLMVTLLSSAYAIGNRLLQRVAG